MIFIFSVDVFPGAPIRESRLQILDNGDLLIAAVRASDHGEYTCAKTNDAGSISGSAMLSVLGEHDFFFHFFLFILIYLSSRGRVQQHFIDHTNSLNFLGVVFQ
jgi:hypothetical protein